jgi:hypothetical protein
MMFNAPNLKHSVSNRSMPGAVWLDHDPEIAERRSCHCNVRFYGFSLSKKDAVGFNGLINIKVEE